MININRLNQNNEYSLGTPNIQTKRSTLKMRETIQSTGMVGKIIPLTVHEVLPSETTRATTQINMEFTPFVTNIIHEINGEISNWFVPYRIIWDKWEEFITGCNEDEDIFDGSSNPPLPKINPMKLIEQIRKNYIHLNKLDDEIRTARITLEAEKANAIIKDTLKRQNVEFDLTTGERICKRIIRTAINKETDKNLIIIPSTGGSGSNQDIIQKAISCGISYLARENIADYYGLPSQLNWIGIINREILDNPTKVAVFCSGNGDEDNIVTSTYEGVARAFQITESAARTNKIISLNFLAYNKIYNDWERLLDWEPRRDKDDLSCAYGKYAWDIFTRARRYQLRGAMPTVPVTLDSGGEATITNDLLRAYNSTNTRVPSLEMPNNQEVGIQFNNSISGEGNARLQFRDGSGTYKGALDILGQTTSNVTIENGSGTWNILDMLTPAGLLNYFMANAKIKPRYANQLLARWGINIQDERFQYAQYLGGNNITITQNGITQTAPQVGDSTVQGNITGQAWGEGGAKVDFYAPEHGVILQLMTIKPSNAYEMGLDCQYIKETRFDYPTPELVDTPDVQIKKSELAPYDDEEAVLGYKAIYDEYRTKFNKVTGLLRPSLYGSLAFKTLARQFDTVDMEKLIRIEDRPFDRVKQFVDQPDFLFIKETNFANSIPLPYINDPRIFI